MRERPSRFAPLLAAILSLAAPITAVASEPILLELLEDDETLAWTAAPGADAYNLYRGEAPGGADLSCLQPGLTGTSTIDPELPASLFTYVVAELGATAGEGPLGSDSLGLPRSPLLGCDTDGDGVGDGMDNCALEFNAGQEDQDEANGGDACDPATYDFESDLPGARPVGMTQEGAANSTFLVRDFAGDRGAGYDGGAAGTHDAFDRIPSPRLHQDRDVYLDTTPEAGEVLTLELWSDGTWSENAGGGLQLRLEADGRVGARVRLARELTPLGETFLPSFERLRLRLRKHEGDASTLHVDRWAGGDWVLEAAVFEVEDDHRLRGRQVSLAALDSGRRPALRVTGTSLPPTEDFALDLTHEELSPWKLFQRGPGGTAPVPVPFFYRAADPAQVEIRVVDTGTGLPLPGHGFSDHVHPLPASPGSHHRIVLPDVPEGGNYHLEARLVDAATLALLGSDAAEEIAVGDVFLAAGQSNMSGYSGVLEPAEPPVPEVHLFGNDYRWKQAREPMDDGTDQVDRVSAETPLHTLMLRFAKEVSAGASVPVAIIPAPLGGTNLHTQWQRNASNPADRGTLYGSSVHRVLTQGYSHPIRGVIWYQGESDVGRGTDLYLQDLENLVAHWRSDLAAPDLFFGNCQLATYSAADIEGWLAIQEAQRRQAESDAGAAVVALVDQPRSDVIHLNVAGYKTAGLRLARAVLAGSYGLSQPLGPQIQEVRFAAGRRNRIEILYDKELSGSGLGLYRVLDDDGSVPVTDVTVSGTLVTLRLQNPAKGAARVTYGYATAPEAAWILAADGSGAALAFREVPAAP